MEKNNDYLEKLWVVFDEIYRILKSSGTVWVNLGDTYNNSSNGGKLASDKSKLCDGKGRNPKFDKDIFVKRRKQKYKQKTLLMIPERFSIGMIERGWILRNQIIWHKPDALPESVKDRFTVDFEKIFFFVKNTKYYFKRILEPYKSKAHLDKNIKYKEQGKKSGRENINFYKQGGRNKRTVWTISKKPFKGQHIAPYPPDIPEICIKAGAPEGGIVLDPFMGSGTTGMVAEQLKRKWIGIELNKEYCEIAKKRILETTPKLF